MYTSIHDPSAEVKQGYNDRAGVGVWGKSGKRKVHCTPLFSRVFMIVGKDNKAPVDPN